MKEQYDGTMRKKNCNTILSIVAEKMTSKALHQRTSGSRLKSVGVRENSSRGGEYASAIGEADVLSRVSRDGESPVVWIS